MRPSTAKEMREFAKNFRGRMDEIIKRKADSLHEYVKGIVYCAAKKGEFDCTFSYIVMVGGIEKAKENYPEEDFSDGSDYVVVDEYFGDNTLSDSNIEFIDMAIAELEKEGYSIHKIFSSTEFYDNLFTVHVHW